MRDPNGDQYWLISRISAVSGGDLRGAEAGRDENGRADVKFASNRRRWAAIRRLYWWTRGRKAGGRAG